MNTISRRDLFAGFALAGLLADSKLISIKKGVFVDNAFMYADAMLEVSGEPDAAAEEETCEWGKIGNDTDSALYFTECGDETRTTTVVKNGMHCLFCGKRIEVKHE